MTTQDTKGRLAACVAEIAAILKKYDACIGAGVGDASDTHGIYDEHISIAVRDMPNRWAFTERRWSGWSIAHDDMVNTQGSQP